MKKVIKIGLLVISLVTLTGCDAIKINKELVKL